MDSRLHIQLLGGFSASYGGRLIAGINTPRMQSLLAYLILNANTPQSRQHVSFLMWPDTSESGARNNLRQYLHKLRQLLPEPERFLTADTNIVCWHQDRDQTIDVQSYKLSMTGAEVAEQAEDFNAMQRWLKEAIHLYHGDLLPGCYDEWIASERDSLRQSYRRANQKLVHLLEQQRDYPGALQIAQSLLRTDPLDESTYATLIRLHELNHDRPAALRMYHSAAETLQRELNVEPGDELRQAYTRMKRTPALRPAEQTAVPLALVGRLAEWQMLTSTWGHVVNGETHFTLITGEAGIGKSRLAEELFNWASQQGFTTARTRSYAAEGRLSLAPVTEWFRSPALRNHFSSLDKMWLTEIARVLPELLGEDKDLSRPEPIGEYGQRQRFFEALARAVLAAPRPVLLWIDDLQWCDPETLEWLHFLLRFEPRSSLLVLGTARSEESLSDHPLVAFARQLRADGKLTSIELSPFDAAETARLATQIEGRPLDDASTLRLYRETEGNPLFVVETVRAGISRSLEDVTTSTTSINQEARMPPPRVVAVIAGRLAQLSPMARKVAELGAAIGRAFALDVLLQAGQEDEASTIRALDELWQKRIVREQGANVFDFTHDKLREVAYMETSAPQRRSLHRRIAQALETLNAEGLDLVSAQIAAHYEQAGMFAQALPYYQRAGAVAASVYANDDAISLLTRALALLTHHPAGTQRDAQELSLNLSLSQLYRITKGWASREVAHVLNRALVLSDKVDDLAQRAQTLYGLQSLYIVQARLEKVQYTYPEMQKLFIQAQGSSPPFSALMYAGAMLHMGHFTEARQQFERIVAEQPEIHDISFEESQGVNHLVLGNAWNSHALWLLGYVQTAFQSAKVAVELARAFEQPFNQALAITYLTMLQEWCADAATFRSSAENAFTLTRDYKAPYYHTWSGILLSFAEAWQQPDSENLKRLRDAIYALTETGARLRLPAYFSLLARACQRAGQLDEGLEAIELGLTESLQNNERCWDAELHRLRGELMGSRGADSEEIEAAFRRALEIAQSQQARSLELRATTSLARMWQATGRSVAAKQILVPLYSWFTEGFDTPDLKAAQFLLAQF